MNSDCVDHLIGVYVDSLRICGQRARTIIRICLYCMYTVLYCSIWTFYYGLLREPMPKVYTISGIIILVSIPFTLFFWMAIELVRKLDESIPIYIYVRQRRHYLHQSMILRSLACHRQQSIQEAVPDSPVVSVSAAPQTAFKVARLPLRRETPTIRYLRHSSLSSATEPTSRLQRSVSGHKKLLDPGKKFVFIPENESKWIVVSLFSDDEERCKIIKEQNPSIQVQQKPSTDTPPTQGELSSRSRQSTGKKKKNENPIPQMDLGGISPILSAKGTLRSIHSTGKKNENPIPQMDLGEISPILSAESRMRSIHSTGKKNENPISQMGLGRISPILNAEGTMRPIHSTDKRNGNPIPQMNVREISPNMDAEGRMRSKHSTDETLDPQMNVPDRPPTTGAVGTPASVGLESRHQAGGNVQKLIVRLKGRLRPRNRTK